MASFQARHIIIIPDTGSISRPHVRHYHFVMRAEDDKGKTFLVPIGTTRPKCDRTVVILPSQYEWIERESIVLYARAALWSRGDLIKNIRLGRFIVHSATMDDQLFADVKNGFLRSPFAAGWAKKYSTGCK